MQLKEKLLAAGIFAFLGTNLHAEQLLNIGVTEQGMHEVTYQQLLDFGLDIQGEPITSIALLSQGQPVAIEVLGSDADPQVVGPGSAIRFFGEPLDTLYTGTNVYTLALDPSAQRQAVSVSPVAPDRMPFATAYLAKKSFAPQLEYSFSSPNANDPWYAKRISALNRPNQERVSLQLDDYQVGGNSGSVKAKLSVDAWGASNMPSSNNDHHVKVSVNGVEVISHVFDGFETINLTSDVDSIQQGSNSVDISLPLDQGQTFDAINLDKIEISYPRAFVAKDNELSFTSGFRKFRVRGFSQNEVLVYAREGQQLQRIENVSVGGRCPDRGACVATFSGSGKVAEYFVLSPDRFKQAQLMYLPVTEDIRSGNAEYLIVTHPDFIAEEGETDELERLVNALQADVNSVDVVNVEQIYAQFGNHLFDPLAIQRYLEFSRNQRNTKMVLLVGGDIYDYRNFENQEARSFIPSIYVQTDDLIRFAPVDAKYVDFNQDNVPDMPIGRLPVRTMNELKVLIDKREAFASRSYANQALFAADRFNDLEQYSFTLDAERMRADYFSSWQVTPAYIDQLDVRDARNRINQSINDGVSLTAFFGHSSTNQWSFEGLFNGFDADNLQNDGRPTVVTQWGCWNTYHVNPNEESMGHRFLINDNRGAVAVMGATTLTSAHNERLLADRFYAQLASGKSLGQAITDAKTELALSRPDALDVLLGWNLLGFPELQL